MKKIILFVLTLFLLIPGCIQTSSEETEKFLEYSYPDTGFTIKYPQSWNVSQPGEFYHVGLSSPDHQASMWITIHPGHHPEGMEEEGYGISYEVPNSTPIVSWEKIQISGANGLKWTFLVNNSDRKYIDGIIMFVQKCPELQNNRILYHIRYDYTTNDIQLENTVNAMLNSIELNCPSMK